MKAHEFMRRWSHGDPWVHAALRPDKTSPKFELTADVSEFVERYNGERNIYFQVNRTRLGPKGKPTRDDVLECVACHVDIDPPDDCDLAAWQATTREELLAWKTFGDLPPPTVILFSGRGFQLFWRLDEPGDFDAVRARNVALVCRLGRIGAADDCYCPSWLMRLPGTVNHKTGVRARVLRWTDDAVSIEDLPVGRDRTNTSGDWERITPGRSIELHEIRWRKLRGLVMSGNPADRSGGVWKVAKQLLELKFSEERVVATLMDRRYGVSAHVLDSSNPLRAACRAVTKEPDVKKPEVELKLVASLDLGENEPWLEKSMADVEEEELDFVWYPYLARGEVTILEGDPGLGKSYLAQMVSAAVCDGLELPCVKKKDPVTGKVAYFDLENAANSVTKKRLRLNGLVSMGNFHQEEKLFTIDDKETLEKVLAALEKFGPTLIVFDTMNHYIGAADTHNSKESQQAMRYFVAIARKYNCAVLVLRHLVKSKESKALYRGQGSIAFAGMARFVITVGTHPDEPDVRAMAVTKINVATTPPALTFNIKRLPDVVKADRSKEEDRSKFVWGKFEQLTADQLVGPSKDRHGRIDEAKEWLAGELKDGARSRADLVAAGEPRGFDAKMLQRARKGIHAHWWRDEFGGPVMWGMMKPPKKKLLLNGHALKEAS